MSISKKGEGIEMKVKEIIRELDWLREELIGRNKMIPTPYGEKPIVYLDYTASGRNLFFIENHLNKIRQYYANSHTEDDFTGKTMTILLHEAEKRVKKSVNAGKHGKIIFTESGTTGGITRLQQILGVYLSPATRERYDLFLDSCLSRRGVKTSDCHDALLHYIDHHKPIVFVSPYEHHSNEIMWRQTLCDVQEVVLDKDGYIDLEALDRIVSDPKYQDRPKIGSFSAGSNVTGLLSDTYAIARILHKHNCLACFDFAACGPYVGIDMNHDEESYYDAIFFSPHKFLGGPGSSGVLIFNENIYRSDLPPSIAAGGTVDYVSKTKELYVTDIETREKPGTPGILQALRVSLAMDLKEKVGLTNIEAIEKYFMKRFYEELVDEDNIEFLGETDPDKKVGIIPFNIKFEDEGKIIHPKFATKLLNDLFGIQTRAGCSCAGPYGHLIMHIERELSERYMKVIQAKHLAGLKPGWIRLNIHYILSEEEFEYTINAIRFISRNAVKFLGQYNFDIYTGEWNHVSEKGFDPLIDLAIDNALRSEQIVKNKQRSFKEVYQENLDKAEAIAQSLPASDYHVFDQDFKELVYFPVVNIVKNPQ
ncbi:MAG: aminotransferase class V-fold PLP-dependent enzyme [Candidatus Stygibacter frigidus]|nr:aminotransferase class V-fold PLP-dependent enzyme [Candidatus Stygibacter frigidus]